MRKINLTNYELEGLDEKREIVKVPYQVKEVVIGILFNPKLKLNAIQLLERDDLARKIKDSQDEVLLEEAEYDKLLKAVKQIEGFGKGDVELVRRILECPKIEVKAK